MKKSVISDIFSALLFVSLSVSSFAATPYHPLPNDPIINVEDGDTVIGTLKTQQLSEAGKNYLRAWLKSSNNLCTYSSSRVSFIILGSDFKSNSSFFVTSDKTLEARTSSVFHFSMLNFDLSTGNPDQEYYIDPSGMSAAINNSEINFGYIFSGTYFKSNPITFTNESIIGFDGRLLIRDDGGILGDLEPPESSSTPASSSTPEPSPDFKPEPPTDPFVPPAPPSFDFGGSTGDLPYDASIWEALMLYLRDTIGSVGTVLLWVLMIIIAIPTVISAIRHFMNQAGGDGNNTSGLI